MSDEQTPPNQTNHYAGLPRLLYAVRWSQHLLSIIAEVLILLSFAMSGMDVSLGGVMASVPILKILWAGMFALGIDTAFALSWVRVRRCVVRKQWLAFSGNILLALSMSLIIFQPLALQLLQQSLNMNFNQAVASLGINIVFLTYARAGVAVFLGAILAITNTADEAAQAKQLPQTARRFVWVSKLTGRFRKQPALAVPVTVNEEQSKPRIEAPSELSAIANQPTMPLQVASASAQPEPPRYDTPEQRVKRVNGIDFTGLSALDRVAKVLELFPDLSDRELGKLSGMSAATAKKYRAMEGIMSHG